MIRLTKTFISVVSLFALLTMMNSSINAQQQNDKTTGVYVSAIKRLELADQIESLGTLRANEAVALASTVTELVTEVNFSDGKRVEKGDVLVQLDISEEVAQKAEEQARYERAKRQVDRFKPLTNRGAASEAALDDARSAMQEARARISAIDARIAQRSIVAPFSGVVGLRNVSVGMFAQPGTPLSTIDDDSSMLLDFSVPEVFLGTLAVGNKIIATTSAYPDQEYEGLVDGIDSRINPVTRSIIVRARIPNQNYSLRPGMLMRVELERSPRLALMAPEEAISPNGDRSFVLIAANRDGQLKAERREVTLGARRAGEVEIIKGLKEGDLVITHGGIKVRNGSAISILAEENGNETLTELLNKPRALSPDTAPIKPTQSEKSQKAGIAPATVTTG